MVSVETVSILGGALAAFVAASLGTPVVRWFARRWGLVDAPDAHRKLHAKGTPLGGGAAILAATLCGFVLSLASPSLRQLVQESGATLLGFLGAALMIAAVGLLDDAKGLRGRQKLFGQIVAVTFLCWSGMTIERIRLFEWEIELGLLAVPVTVCWLLGAVNAMNLLDGADGMAATVGLVLSASLAIMAAWMGRPVEAAIAAALAGASLGFLLYNFPPASIFLGDCGSMLLGLTLGVLAIRSSLKGPATVAMATPVALLAIPMLDCTAAILRRRLTGRSIYTTDRGHLHHCLLRRGTGPRGLLVWVGGLCGATAVGALTSVYWNNEPLAFFCAAMVIVALVASRIFGFSELLLVVHRIAAFSGSLFAASHRKPGLIRQKTVMLQGSRNWDEIWQTLTDFAELHQLCQVYLDLNLPWMHEGYHAEWERRHALEPSEMWFLRLPLTAHGRKIGRIEIAGPDTHDADYRMLVLLAEVLDTLDPCLRRLSAELPDEADAASTRSSYLVSENR
jgi:UDP-GlcNAc:undecaprenyl-phosphate GlcNAc-1-phosphate transferase